ncbi:MAG TPA: LuxR C-terminal-related transcriptional regulator [Ktedonobacteraceae bacterium]
MPGLALVRVTRKEIAERMVIALDSTKRYVSNILSKLGANNRTQAVTHARSLGML